jgi:uncharacterized DUF497 family protein
MIHLSLACSGAPGDQCMRFTWRREKERSNIIKHGLDFSVAEHGFADPLADTLWDGVTNGEERWRIIGAAAIGGRLQIVVVVYTYPNPDDDTWVQVISLREATTHERRRYEISHL